MKAIYKYILVLPDGSLHVIMSEINNLQLHKKMRAVRIIPVVHGTAQLKFDNNTGKMLKPSQALYPHSEETGWQDFEFAKDAFQSRLYFGITPKMAWDYMAVNNEGVIP